MPLYTRRHYIDQANNIRREKEQALAVGDLFALGTLDSYQARITETFQLDNSRFNSQTFTDACKPRN